MPALINPSILSADFANLERDLQAIARIVIAACERWENRQGVGG